VVKLYSTLNNYVRVKDLEPSIIFPLKGGGEIGLRFGQSLNDIYYIVCRLPTPNTTPLSVGERVERPTLDHLIDFEALDKKGAIPDELAEVLINAGLLIKK